MESLPLPRFEGCRRAQLVENADMSKYTSFRAGGCAAALVEVENVEELRAVLRFASDENIPHMMLGNGSNMLFKDSGYEGLVIKLGMGFDYTSTETMNKVFPYVFEEGEKVISGIAGTKHPKKESITWSKS